MSQQIPLGPEARAGETDPGDGTRQVRPDLAYRRLAMVNVVFIGAPRAGDRNWVLVDAGLAGTRALIAGAAAARFGEGARPSAIVLTHGHFDHVGTLEALAAAWDAPVYAHPLEHPYLDGRASYPPGDPSVGGGLMAGLAGLYPTKPVDVSGRLRALPEDGSVPGLEGWRWLHTPGHSPAHVSLWHGADRILIVGDAFVTTAPESAYATAVQAPEMHGPPRYFTPDWAASRASVERLAALDPVLAVAGHGRPMAGPAMAAALRTLARTFDAVAVPRTGRYVAHRTRTGRDARAGGGRHAPVRLPAGLGGAASASTRSVGSPRDADLGFAQAPHELVMRHPGLIGRMSHHALNLAVAAFTGYALATWIHRGPTPRAAQRGSAPDRGGRSRFR